MDYISASALMFKEIGYRQSGDNSPWTLDVDKIAALRRTGAVDKAVNEALAARVEGDVPAVFDSWTLPFMARTSPNLASSVLYIKLDSDANSRAIKCLVSQGPAPHSSIGEAASLIKGKDTSSRNQFRETFGIVIFRSTTGIPATNIIKLNVTQCVFGTSPEQIRHGIRIAHSLLTDAVKHKIQSSYMST